MPTLDEEIRAVLGSSRATRARKPVYEIPVGLYFLFCLFLVVAVLGLINKNQQEGIFPAKPPEAPVQPGQQLTPLPPQITIQQIDQRFDRLEGGIRRVWDRSKWNSDRLTLLATIHNHNMVVIKNALPKTELILLNSDWTINRLPDRIRLDAQDQEFLKQFLRK